MEAKFYNIDEIAKFLGVQKSTIYAWVHTRQIPYYKVGRLLKFKQTDIDMWIEERRIEPINIS